MFDVFLGLVVLPAIVVFVLASRGRDASGLRLYGARGYAINFGLPLGLLIVALVPALIFYSVSMLVAAVRGYAGCEIFAIPSWFNRRDDRMACPVFSPVDRAEARSRLAGTSSTS